MTKIFNGREFAATKLRLLKERVIKLQGKQITPKLVSIIVGDDPASKMYVNLKKKRAEEIGATVEVKNVKSEITKDQLIQNIKILNTDPLVNGIMIQLPLPDKFSDSDRDEIINVIDPKKDVDGLQVGSKFIPPTAKAVLEILIEALKVRPLKGDHYKVAVLGATGFIGQQIFRSLTKEYKNMGINELEIFELNSKTKDLESQLLSSDVIVSVTGVTDLVKADFVKPGAILIDVGAPNGDIEKSAYEKSGFVSPVPGGVGPVTISCLMENLIVASENNIF